MTTIIDFVSDPAFLGPFFGGDSWDRWRAVFRAADAQPMSERDLELFQEIAGDRRPPARRVKELVALVGRGGGKNSTAAALAAYIAVTSDFSCLRPGERGTVICIACDRDQAAIAFNYVRGLFEAVPLLAALVERIGADTIELKTGAEIVVGTNSMRSVRGKTYAAAIYDEVAFYVGDGYANPDSEVDAAISPGLARFPGSLKIMISSVHRRAGLLYDRYARYFGRDDDDVLVVLGSSLQFNPTLDAAEIDRQLAADRERAAAEYLSQWRYDLTNFLDRELVEAATDFSVRVRPPQPGIRYVSFSDPSGGRGDSFTCAIAHADGNTVVLDALYERRAPFDPSSVVLDIANLHRSYGLAETTGDRYAANWVTEGFGKEGIAYRQSERDKSSIFLDGLPLFTGGRIRILDDPRLRSQLIALERRTTRTGRDIVSHPDHGNAHDDVANAVVGAATLAASESAPALWRSDHLLVDNAPLPWPVSSRSVYLTAAVDGNAVFVGFWATGAQHFPYPPAQRPMSGHSVRFGPRCILVDFQRAQIAPDLFVRARDRAAQLAAMTVPSRNVPAGELGLSVVAPDLRSFAAGQIDLVSLSVAQTVLADRDRALLVAAAELGAGRVKLALPAAESSLRLPNPLGEIHPGALPSAAADAALLGVIASIPRQEWPREWRAPRAA
jgi:hypothetical protein